MSNLMQHIWMPHVCFESIEWLYKYDMKLYNQIYMELGECTFISEWTFPSSAHFADWGFDICSGVIFARSYGK